MEYRVSRKGSGNCRDGHWLDCQPFLNAPVRQAQNALGLLAVCLGARTMPHVERPPCHLAMIRQKAMSAWLTVNSPTVNSATTFRLTDAMSRDCIGPVSEGLPECKCAPIRQHSIRALHGHEIERPRRLLIIKSVNWCREGGTPPAVSRNLSIDGKK